ncbi:MAG: DUF1634 domain-containing protein [Candidatus Acidiferrales bacterium]
MEEVQHGWSQQRFETLIGQLLRIGVSLSAAVVLAGGVLYLIKSRGTTAERLRVFTGEPDTLRHISGIVRFALQWHSRGLIQLGLLILIATPVARVAFSVLGFAGERDWLYTKITLAVLAILLYGLIFT